MQLPVMVARWQNAWQSLAPEPIAALYAPDATHMSEGVISRMSRPDGTLKGRDDIRAYAEAAAAGLESFRADIIGVIVQEAAHGGRAAVEYWRIVNGNDANRRRVVEIIEWRDDLITACRVFHF